LCLKQIQAVVPTCPLSRSNSHREKIKIFLPPPPFESHPFCSLCLHRVFPSRSAQVVRSRKCLPRTQALHLDPPPNRDDLSHPALYFRTEFCPGGGPECPQKMPLSGVPAPSSPANYYSVTYRATRGFPCWGRKEEDLAERIRMHLLRGPSWISWIFGLLAFCLFWPLFVHRAIFFSFLLVN